MTQSKDFSELVIKQSDCQRLLSVIDANNTHKDIDLLENELSRAEIVEDSSYPQDAVCLGADVTFLDCETKQVSMVTVVLPSEVNVSEMKISILSPIGSALIGMRTGRLIDWLLPNKRVAKIQILSVKQH